MNRTTILRLAALTMAGAVALAAAPASAGGFHRGGYKGHHGHGYHGWHGRYGHGYKHFRYSGFHGGPVSYGYGGPYHDTCFWTFHGFKKVKVCY